MKSAIAIRRFSHEGTDYSKGAAMLIPADQFAAWVDAGLIAAPIAQQGVATKAKWSKTK